MKKPLLKTVAVAAVGASALAVCFFGYRVNAGKQYDQMVTYAQTAVKKESSKLTEIDGEIKALYSDKNLVFLRNGLKDTDVSVVAANLDAVKVSADEFGIEEKDMPTGAKAIGEQKENLETQLDDADIKFNIQEEVNLLFTKGVSNWQTVKNDVIIKDTLKDTDVGEIREQLKLVEGNQWNELVTKYLDFASAQITRSKNIRESIAKMVKDGNVTEAATYDSYLNLVNSIAQVQNEKLKADYQKSADTINSQLGLGLSSEAESSESDIDYGQMEENIETVDTTGENY